MDTASQRGMAILVTILLAGIMLSVVFALTAVFVPKIHVAADTKNSVPAAYAAETGLEWCLYVNQKGPINEPSMGNGSKFAITGANCTVSPIQVIGTYRGITRAFELSF